MNQTIGSSQVHKSAEICQASDVSCKHVSFFEAAEQVFLLLPALLFNSSTFREDKPVTTAIYLDNFETQTLANQMVPLPLFAGTAPQLVTCQLRPWYESTYLSKVDDQSAFVLPDNFTFVGLAGLVQLLRSQPVCFGLCPRQREDGIPLFVFGSHNVDGYLLPLAEGSQVLTRQSLHLAPSDDPLRLGPDVDQDLMGSDAHNRSRQNVAAPYLL